jgi:hypothetical protein
LLALGVARSTAINNDVLGISRSATEKIHDHYTVIGVGLDERVAGHPDLPYLRETGQARHFRRVHEVVVPKVQPLQRQESLNASQGTKSVTAKVQGGDGWERVSGKRMHRLNHAVRQIQSAQ